MNLADYLSELLGQYDEVSVPGLGYFVRKRINGFYHDGEAKFYPPHHQVKFVPDAKDDDIFTQYVADKKNISLASSKYFAEKFVSNLREQATKGTFIFADLGMFRTEHEQLVFKPNERITPDPEFYGYAPVFAFKLGTTPKPSYTEPVVPSKPVPPPSPVIPPKPTVAQVYESEPTYVPVQNASPDQYYEEDIEKKRKLSIWVIVVIITGLLAIGIVCLFKFYPPAYEKANSLFHKMTGKEQAAPVIRHETKTDSATHDTTKKLAPVPVAKDTAKAAVITPVDTAKHSRFELVENNFRLMGFAALEVKKLKAKGINAYILTDAPGPRLKVSVGKFDTKEAAQAELLNMKNTGKVGNQTYILEIKQQ